jgi:hypothetical protein
VSLMQRSQVVEAAIPAAVAFAMVALQAPEPTVLPWIGFAWAPIAAWALVRKCSDDSRILGIAYRRGKPFSIADLAAQAALLATTAVLATLPAIMR